MKIIKIISFICMLCLVACTMAPRYERPAAPVDAQWPAGAAYEETTHDEAPGAAEIPWRDFIGDGRLREVIDRALQNNRDLRIAALNVELTKAMYGISTATLLPVLNVTGAWFRERVPADLSPSGSAYTAEKFIVNLGMSSWEIDFFGRIRSLRDRALQEYLAGIEARRG
ncbi:MAG: TolC family protein, partial [Bacillota bacterium]|nr:TolC family protein [Bacillota bacterium]